MKSHTEQKQAGVPAILPTATLLSQRTVLFDTGCTAACLIPAAATNSFVHARRFYNRE